MNLWAKIYSLGPAKKRRHNKSKILEPVVYTVFLGIDHLLFFEKYSYELQTS